MVSVTHAKIAAGQDSGDGKVSSNAWNDGHLLTGTPNMLVGFDAGGAGTEIDPATLSDIAAVRVVADRTALAALDHSLVAGFDGNFWTFVPGDQMAHVSADTAKGLYVAPATDPTGAAGAWVRKYDGGVKPSWFGVVYGDTTTGTNCAVNNAAISAMFATLASLEVGSGSPFLPDIDLGFGTIEISQTFAPPGVCNIKGRGSGNWSGASPMAGSCIKAYGCTGVSLDYMNSQMSDVLLQGDYTDALGEAEYHGVAFSQRVTLQRVKVHSFRGDGFNCDGQGSAGHLPDSSSLIDCDARGCRNGTSFGVHGGNSDANVIRVEGGVFNSNRQWAHYDAGELGNTYIATESNGNGAQSFNDGVSGGASLVVYNGHSYFAIAGQETPASTNAPSGDTTDNTWWAYKSDGGGTATTGKPAWFSGILVRAGGSVYTTSNVAQHLFSGCYAETNQGRAQTAYPTIIDHGVLSGVVWQGSAGVVRNVTLQNSLGIFNTSPIQVSAFSGANGSFTAQLGERSSSQRTFLRFSGSGFATFGRALKAVDDTSGDMVLDTGHSIPYAMFITGANTAQMHGTGAAMPHAFRPYKLIIPEDGNNNTDNGRRQAYGTAAPTTGTHARGEIYWNKSAAVGSPIGWMCTVAGTPGTWAAMANL